MSDKYYTPEVEEFHAEFEYEYSIKGNEEWEIMSKPCMAIVDYGVVKKHLKDKNDTWTKEHYRVKCLDREDIESLGFNHQNWQYPNNKVFWFTNGDDINKPSTWIGLVPAEKHVIVARAFNPKTITRDGLRRPMEHYLFSGRLKNKSELKRILKQIGV